MFGLFERARKAKAKRDIEKQYKKLVTLYDENRELAYKYGKDNIEIKTQLDILYHECGLLDLAYSNCSKHKLFGFCGTPAKFMFRPNINMKVIIDEKLDFQINRTNVDTSKRFLKYIEVEKLLNVNSFKGNINDFIYKKTKLKLISMLQDDFGDDYEKVYNFIFTETEVSIYNPEKLNIALLFKPFINENKRVDLKSINTIDVIQGGYSQEDLEKFISSLSIYNRNFIITLE